MPIEQIEVIVLLLGDEPLVGGTHAAHELEPVVVFSVLIPHAQPDVGIAKSLGRIEGEDVAGFIDVAIGRRNLARR